MAYTKKTFVDNQTIIDADTLNKMQDTIIANESGVAQANNNISKQNLKTGSVLWKGITFSFYKQGRMVWVRAFGSSSVEIDAENKYSADLIPYPSAEFKPAGNYTEVTDLAAGYRGQFNAIAEGLQVGYTRSVTTNAAAKIPAGTTMYFSRIYVTES